MRASLLPNPTRIATVDVLRWLSFYAIVVYHLTFALWARGGWTEIPISGPLVWPLEGFARLFAFSGFTVLFLSFFLFGFRSENSFWPAKRLFWLVPFTLVWMALADEFPYWWDIYPFLLCVFALIAVVRRLRAPASWLIWVGALGLSLPFWRLEAVIAMPNHFLAALFGVCESRRDLGDWPLFPWAFYPVFAYGLGRWTYPHRTRATEFKNWEFPVWGLILIGSTPFLGTYASTPLGENFGCFVFRRPAIEFWAHQAWLIFALRLGLLTSVNRWVASRKLYQWIAESTVNRTFFVAYFAHYPAVLALGWLARRFDVDFESWILAASFAMIFIFVECTPGAAWRKANVNLSTT